MHNQSILTNNACVGATVQVSWMFHGVLHLLLGVGHAIDLFIGKHRGRESTSFGLLWSLVVAVGVTSSVAIFLMVLVPSFGLGFSL